MSDQPEQPLGSDPAALSQAMARIAMRSQSLITDFLMRHAKENANGGNGAPNPFDPLNVGAAFVELTARMMSDPATLARTQMQLWQDYVAVWQNAAQRMIAPNTPPLVQPERGDRRFRDAAWDESVLFDFIKQTYLLTARTIQDSVSKVEGLDDKTAQKLDFYTRQFVDALAPTNFATTNPEVLRATMESRGENLVRGLENLFDDLEAGEGKLRVRQTDEAAFKVGRDMAVTPGSVVFENDLMQLIQYEPTTKKVATTPLLIIPPWINKYYILDLRPDNSFVRWCVAQGLTVFVISWVNPDAELAEKDFADYLREGPIAALDAIEQATGQTTAHAVGYCLGGTLLATTMAYLTAHKMADRIASATFLATMIDFSEAGELTVFIDEEQLTALERRMDDRGYLDGAEMANTFNMLRANDLIWSFVVSNYMLGKQPLPFDLLYWNSDSTRMPAAMHSFYLRNMYQQNQLVVPGGIEIEGTPIDLRQVKTPVFLLSTRDDHIAPWQSTYAATQLFSGPVTFCVSASGHIAGVVNPPKDDKSKEKYCYWTNPKISPSPDNWLSSAERHDGSWWPNWRAWLADTVPDDKPASPRKPGTGLKVIEPAPGRYVLAR